MTSELLTQILLALLGAAWVGDFINGLFQKKKVKADSNLSDANATQIIVASTTTLLAPLSARVKELETEVTVLRNALSEATTESNILRNKAHEVVMQLESCSAENKRVTKENRQLRARLATQ